MAGCRRTDWGVPAVGPSRLVARTELRRRLRGLAGHRFRLVALGVAVLFLGFTAVLFAVGAYWFAPAVVAGRVALPVETLRGGIGVAWVGLAGLVGVRTVGKTGRPDHPDGVLVATGHEDVLGGIVLAESALVLAWTSVPAVLVAAAFAAGAGTPVVVPATLSVLALGVGSAVPVGYGLGLAVRHAFTRFEPVARYKTLATGLAVLAYVGAIVSGGFDRAVAALLEPLAASPVGWLADVVLAVLGRGSPLLAGLAVTTTSLVALTALAVSSRVAAVHWFSDPLPEGEASTGTDLEDRSPLGDRLSVLDRRTRVVTAVVLRRSVRSPMRLLYVLYPLFGLAGVVGDAVRSGQVPPFLPGVALLYGAWAAGAAFTLNSLGDQGATLPVSLSSPAGGRAFVRGRVLAGSLVGVPLAGVLVAAVGAASPLSAERVVALVAATPVAVPAATALSTGIGVALPRFGTVQVTRNRRAVVPSKGAFLVYSVALLGGVLAWGVVLDRGVRVGVALALSALASLVGFGVGPGLVRAAGLAVGLAWLVAPALSYRYAVRRFDDYRLE